jgi:hypothetical protein
MAAPSSYFKFGTVTDTYFGVVADQNLDPVRNPDLVPVQGRVVFTPTLPNGAPLLFTSAPFVATVSPVTAIYNDFGQLTLNDIVGVRLDRDRQPARDVHELAVDGDVHRRGRRRQTCSGTRSRSACPGDTTVDLATVQTVAVVNGVPSTVGPRGRTGFTGILLRGVYTGTTSSVLPSGYGATQDGYTYRVRSVDGSFDRAVRVGVDRHRGLVGRRRARDRCRSQIDDSTRRR